MPVLFVSHSSKDDVAAIALEKWLRARGFTDLFIDHHNILGGEKWAQALRDAAGACRVIICLVTNHWLASDECFGEFKAAWYMGKPIIPLLALSPNYASSGGRLASVLAEYQGFDVGACMDAGGGFDLTKDREIERRLEGGLRAAGALARIGLDPEAFPIERKLRPTPFPGLASFGDDDADAALFYGRSREIAEVLEELRKVRAERDLRPFVILGASGAGKSSLLKAGIIPRLRRETPAWLPLRAFRPGADPLQNFAEALARTMADFGKIEASGVIRDRLFAAWTTAEREDKELTPTGRAILEVTLEAEGRTLRDKANHDGATILISIDQAEELARAEGVGAEALADYLQTALSSATSHWQLAFTIRTDSFPELQRHHRFQNLKARGYDLRAVPVFRFESVVADPAKRYGVQIDEELVSTLINDAPEEDALPLLAFTLQRLWHRYAAGGVISKDNYVSVGGLRQLIEDAAERALHCLVPDQDVPIPPSQPPQQRVELAAAIFVPGLAQLNEQGAFIRRAAPWSDFTGAQQQLLVSFDQWRLVVRKAIEADSGTVEIAHEALFREWTRLKNWLEPERARLEALRLLQLDALTWDRSGRDPSFINHRDSRLTEVRSLAETDRYRKRLNAIDFAYLAACEQAARRAQQLQRRARALIGALVMAVVAGLAAWWQQDALKLHFYVLRNVNGNVLTAAQEKVLKPRDSFTECTDCPEMVLLPAGKFRMGSPPTEKDRSDNEGPNHEISIAEAFAVSRHEVTFDQWETCVQYGPCARVGAPFGGGKQPAINVSWGDAQVYVKWLHKLTDQRYRLLTEAEWEYAARAASAGPYSFEGDDKSALDDYAWYSKNSDEQSHPVGQKKPNGFGLYDMHGNVWEWVEDCYHENYDGAPSDGSAWTTGDCNSRVVRGGSYSSKDPRRLRSAHRAWLSSPSRGDIGFRVARTLDVR